MDANQNGKDREYEELDEIRNAVELPLTGNSVFACVAGAQRTGKIQQREENIDDFGNPEERASMPGDVI